MSLPGDEDSTSETPETPPMSTPAKDLLSPHRHYFYVGLPRVNREEGFLQGKKGSLGRIGRV